MSAGLVSVTVTPGSSAALVSVTRPKISPVLICARAREPTVTARQTKSAIRRTLIPPPQYTTRTKKLAEDMRSGLARSSAVSHSSRWIQRGCSGYNQTLECLRNGIFLAEDVFDDEPDVR